MACYLVDATSWPPNMSNTAVPLACIPAREHVVFIGDSLTRYQWLMLALSVAYGKEWDDVTEHGGKQKSGTCAPHDEKTWPGQLGDTDGSWYKFFHGTTAMLRRPRVSQASCDCCACNRASNTSYRTVPSVPCLTSPAWVLHLMWIDRNDRCCHSLKRSKFPCSTLCYNTSTGAETWETRHFAIRTKGADVGAAGDVEEPTHRGSNHVHLSYAALFGRMPMRGRWKGPGAEPSSGVSPEVRPAAAGHEPLWMVNFTTFVRQILPQWHPKPTVVVFNLGFWLGRRYEQWLSDKE